MKKRYFGWGLLLAVLILMAGAGCQDKDGESKPDVKDIKGDVKGGGENPVWIRVNGKDVNRSRIEAEISKILTQLSSQMPPEQIESIKSTVKRDVMQREVQKIVLGQAIIDAGITTDEAEIETEMTKIQNQFPDPELFKQKLEEMQMTEADLKEEISRGMLYRKLLESKAEVAEPSEKEVSDIYERAKDRMKEPPQAVTRHILFTFPPIGLSEEDKLKKKEAVAAVRKRIEGGEDIGALAMELSDASSKADGGKQTFTKGDMPDPFDAVVFGLKPGELSSVIETPMGLHIVKLEELTPERTPPLEEMKEEIVNFLKESQKKQVMESSMESLMKGANVEYLEPLPVVAPMPVGMGMPHGGGGPPGGGLR